ncbi:methanogenesis marker 3 protein [Methanopyrus sp. KOL6]|uniref:methyl-coenzyme M reductase-associated protein Mmp3 n=1 Tax=Methanopyrus sp. KOL6 TaxID=1937004 RepID=UPI000B4C1F50|nr:methanogenesis marker 3 protein [Methanopyrus sp. KOL6]
MRVYVDGEPVDVPEEATVRDALEVAGVSVPEDVTIAVFKGEQKVERETDRIRIMLETGDEELPITVAVEDERMSEVCEELPGISVSWTTRDEVGLGPVDISDLEFHTRRGVEVPPYTTIMILPTNDPSEAYFLITKRRMAVEYICTDIQGRITAGRELVDELCGGERVTHVEPVVERVTERVVSKVTLDDGLEAGDRIITRVEIELEENAPVSAEHLLNTLEMEEGRFRIKFRTDTFTSIEPRRFYDLPEENVDMRERGVVTVRNRGVDEGVIYVYRRDRTPVESHNVVGRVRRGMELLDVVTEGDRVLVETDPPRVNFVGLTVDEARKLAEEFDVELEVNGDGDVVVDQEPRETLNVLKERKARVEVAPEDEVIEIELYEDNAPRSVEYFRRVAKMLDRPVGRLKVHFAYADLGMIVFEGDEKLGKKLPPENNPKDRVEAGVLGVTNQAKPHAGLIGVRLEDSEEYGPTGETFEGTNVIGRVVEGLDRLREMDQSDMGHTVYVREVRGER